MSLSRLEAFERRLERQRRIRQIPLSRLKDRNNPLEAYNAAQFKDRFHMYKETAVYIASLIRPELSATLKRGIQLPPIIKLLTVLRFYATGDFQISMGDLSCLSQPTVSKLVKKVSIAIAKLCPDFIRYPSFESASTQKSKFFDIGGFPGVVGCIDGTHIEILSPGGDDAELFRNRKGYFSINVQGVCDAELNFTNVVAKWYGSSHDSRIFENSSLYDDLENNKVPGLLLGDAGYTLSNYLMTPISNPVTAPQKKFNKCQIKTRNTIERTFGIWKRKFNCLTRML